MNRSQPTAQLLATRAARGDRPALEALCAEVWPDVRRLALIQLGEPAPAEDAAQESLIALVRHIHRYDPARPFGPWLRTIVRNQCRSATRKQPVQPPSHPTPAGADLDRKLDLDRAAATALEAFATLTPRQREVIALCDQHGLAPADVAAELEIAQGTARALLHQARTTLRKRLLAHAPELLALVTHR